MSAVSPVSVRISEGVVQAPARLDHKSLLSGVGLRPMISTKRPRFHRVSNRTRQA